MMNQKGRVDVTIIIDRYSERSPHIYNIKSSELYALNKRESSNLFRQAVTKSDSLSTQMHVTRTREKKLGYNRCDYYISSRARK